MTVPNVLVCAVICICVTMVTCSGTRRPLVRGRKILVFGGNGFLGADTVHRFIRNGDNVTTVNRGNWYWDSFNRIKPYVGHVSCDRANGVGSCVDLVRLVNDTDRFDAVVDFSAYDERAAREAAALLRGKADLYVLISTDSVYDVCDKRHDGRTTEADAVRPEDAGRSAQLNDIHRYGDNKLRAEDELVRQRRLADGLRYVILRLPDVIGPRDSTYRWWMYQLWIRLQPELPARPLTVPDFLVGYPISLVYSGDVSRLIFDLLRMDVERIGDEAFNVAYDETFTLERLIRAIGGRLGLDGLDVGEEADHTRSLYLYPSVRTGPVDVSKAAERLDWKPAPFDQAVDDIVQFYEDAMTGDTFYTQRDEVIQSIVHRLFADNPSELYDAIEKVYGINMQHFKPKDEL